MAKVAIVTDSSVCLPQNLIEQFDITIVPLAFLIDGQSFPDGSLSPHQFFDLMAKARHFPTTASPGPGVFLETYKEVAQRADAILCITLSSKFSGTYSSAINAANLAGEELPGFPIHVVDSRSLAMCHGFAVLAAARVAAATGDIDAAIKASQKVSDRAILIGVLDTLRYLARSGRVPWIVHWATSLLQIKPILMARQEETKALERVRTRQRALDRLLYHTHSFLDGGQGLHIAVMHADAPLEAQALAQRIGQELQPVELLITEFTPVMGIHTGPAFLGVAFYSAPAE